MSEYTHLELNKEYCSISGYYIPCEENLLKYNGRDVLYVLGRAAAESTCCGSGNWDYILVVGYVIKWQYKKNQSGLPVSEIEIVNNPTDKENLIKVIQKAKPIINRIDFW